LSLFHTNFIDLVVRRAPSSLDKTSGFFPKVPRKDLFEKGTSGGGSGPPNSGLRRKGPPPPPGSVEPHETPHWFWGTFDEASPSSALAPRELPPNEFPHFNSERSNPSRLVLRFPP